MYREMINELARYNSRAVVQAPALPDDIQKAEKIVGYPFPSELKDLLLELDGDKWLLLSSKEIIDTVGRNREYLLECYKDIGQHIFFAGNGCGDYYCYNISDDGSVDNSKIFIWDHETNETRFVASSITELITRYYHNEI